MLPPSLQACLDRLCELIFFRAEWSSDDVEAPDGTAASDTACITVYWDSVCEQYSHIQFLGSPPHPVGYLSPAAVTKMVAANLSTFIDALTSSTSFLTSLTMNLFDLPAFCTALCEKVVKVTPFDGASAQPSCTPDGPCIEFFRDTSLISDDCPGGQVTHACIGGSIVCFGSGTGGEPEPMSLPLTDGTSGAWTVGHQCTATYPNAISAANLADIQGSAGMCGDSTGGAGVNGGFELNFAHTGGDLKICFDVNDGGVPGVTFDYTTFELLNGLTTVPPSSVDGGASTTADTYVDANCSPARTVQRFNIPSGGATICLTFNGLAAGNYTINTGGWNDGSFAGSGFPQQCLSNLILEIL